MFVYQALYGGNIQMLQKLLDYRFIRLHVYSHGTHIAAVGLSAEGFSDDLAA